MFIAMCLDSKKIAYVLIFSIFLMSSIDAALTLRAVKLESFVECNPVMRYTLNNFGPSIFLLVKAIFTIGPCAYLAFVVYSGRILLYRPAILIVFGSYFVLILYWLFLIYKFGFDFSGVF